MPKHRVWTIALVLSLLIAAAQPARANGFWRVVGWLDELSGPGPFTGPTFSFEHCIGRVDKSAQERYRTSFEAFSVALKDYEAANTARQSTSLNTDERRHAEEKFDIAKEKHNQTEAELRSATRSVRSSACRFDRSNQRLALSYEFSPRMNMVDEAKPLYDGGIRVRRHVGVVYLSLASIAEALDGPDLDQSGAIAEGLGRHRLLRGIEIGTGFGIHRYHGDGVVGETLWHPVIPLRGRLNVGGLIPSPGRRRILQRAVSPLSFRFGWDLVPGPLASSAFNYTGDPKLFVDKLERVRTYGLSYDVGLLVWGKH